MTFLNVTEIESALIGLSNTYPSLTELLPLPNVTFEGRRSHALLIRGDQSFKCRKALVFVSGVHAREWGGPDILVNLATDLLEAYTANAGLAYGGKTFSAATIRAILDRSDVVVFPDINPDGRAYSMAAQADSTQAMWRKNRHALSSPDTRVGVDVNRNYDFLWDFKTKFSPTANSETLASEAPAHDLYHGTGPFSEPETRNVQWLLEKFPKARYFVDIHSYGGDVLYPWGDDQNQSTDPAKSFANTAWDGKRGMPGDDYGEYIPAARLAEVQASSAVVRDGINVVQNQGYVSTQGFWLWGTTYPTSGASVDWAFSREFLRLYGKLDGICIEFKTPSRANILGLLFPTFFPTWSEMQPIIREVDAGLVNLCDYALPSPIEMRLCRIKSWWHGYGERFYTFWRRLFPPEIWGPYGPWTRIARQVEKVLEKFATRRRG